MSRDSGLKALKKVAAMAGNNDVELVFRSDGSAIELFWMSLRMVIQPEEVEPAIKAIQTLLDLGVEGM